MNPKSFITRLIAFLAVVLFVSACQQQPEPQTAAPQAQAPAPETYEWKMVTTWPKGLPGLGTAAERLAEKIEKASNGRIKITYYAAGELVGAFEVFDAVSRGTAQLGHGAAYYWKGKAAASQFFTAVPFGMTAQEMHGWILHGGGQALWDEVYAPFNLKAFPAGNTGVQMGGWFNKEINSSADLAGLKMRIPGIGGEVLKRLGGTPVSLPGGEIFTALQTNTLDATEWVGPYNDQIMGFNKAAKYYYFPGWHEPGSVLELMVNKEAYEALPADLQAIVEITAHAAVLDMLSEYTTFNNEFLDKLVASGVILKEFPDDVMKEFRNASYDYYREVSASDPVFKKVWDSFRDYKEKAQAWHAVSEEAYMRARAKAEE